MTSGSQSSAPVRSRRPPGENRERLIEAGLIEFGLFGYHGASTAGIAARAEVPQPHVYASFPSKRALFLAVVRRVAERLAEPAAGPLAKLNLPGADREGPATATATATAPGVRAEGVPPEPAAGGPSADAPAAADSPALRAHGAGGRPTESDAADAAQVLLQAIALAADPQLGHEIHLELSTLRTRIGGSAFDQLVLRGAELLLTRPGA
ncbi:TetR/AcrR family transcriptional regulator [Leucobacter sp. HNU]|uniref:TetR/AcrR family transcriptional regulator n=1 Tax=Leucobacter sp. HNU TaxID=3236805 RepID=UPI003A811F29